MAYDFYTENADLIKEKLEQEIRNAITNEGAFYNHCHDKVKFVPFYPELLTETVLV